MMTLNVARLASYPVAVTAVLICAAAISLRITQTPSRPSIAQVTPALPSQVVSDESWSLAEPASTRVTTPQSHIQYSNFSTHRTTTPPRYVLDSMPVSYESTLRF